MPDPLWENVVAWVEPDEFAPLRALHIEVRSKTHIVCSRRILARSISSWPISLGPRSS